jgi:pimeloyl-ACP methyl ester carboxylesterase
MKPPNKPTNPLPSFRASSDAGVPECFIANPRQSRDVLVVVHGSNRNAGEIAMRFAIHPAFSRMTIIAPLFTEERFGQYQELAACTPDQAPADAALIRLLDELASELEIATDRFALFGISGGAQMAHRFAMFHPQRVSRLCLASTDWYSLPRADLPYPYGIGGDNGAALVGPDFFDIPTTVIVGNRDTRLDASLRQDDLIVEHQGKNRLRRARCYVRAAHAYADAMGKAGRPQLLTRHGISPDFNQSVLEGDLIAAAAQALL